MPQFLKNEMLEKELAWHGQLVSPIKMIPLGCKSLHLKHVMSFRRQVFMILKQNNEELNLAFSFCIDDFDYTVHVTSETLKCFGCGAEGHLVRSCALLRLQHSRRSVLPVSLQHKKHTQWRTEHTTQHTPWDTGGWRQSRQWPQWFKRCSVW